MTDLPDLTLDGKIRQCKRFPRKKSKILSRSEVREIGERVAAKDVTGETMTDIANSMGVTRDTLYKHLKYDDLTKQALIRIQENHLRQTLPKALEVQNERLNDPHDPSLQYQVAKDVMAQASMTPVQHQSIYVQQTFNQANLYMTPFVKELIDKRNKEIDNFVDVEVLEKKG